MDNTSEAVARATSYLDLLHFSIHRDTSTIYLVTWILLDLEL